MPDAKKEYVAWIDIMGTRKISLNLSGKISAVKIFKLYDAVIQSQPDSKTKGYPMGDGMFLTSPDGDLLLSDIEDIYTCLAHEIVDRYRHDPDFEVIYMPILKGIISHGEVYHGTETKNASLNSHNFAENIVLGRPLINSFNMEADTPPFGITLHESASTSSSREAYKWWSDQSIPKQLWEVIKEYYSTCIEMSQEIGYPLDKIKEHRGRAKWYLREI